MKDRAFNVNKKSNVEVVAAFIRKHGARGASGHPHTHGMVYLLKPTERGGRTLARIFVDEGADEVFSAAWMKATSPIHINAT